jgi:hypothetical protein
VQRNSQQPQAPSGVLAALLCLAGVSAMGAGAPDAALAQDSPSSFRESVVIQVNVENGHYHPPDKEPHPVGDRYLPCASDDGDGPGMNKPARDCHKPDPVLRCVMEGRGRVALRCECMHYKQFRSDGGRGDEVSFVRDVMNDLRIAIPQPPALTPGVITPLMSVTDGRMRRVTVSAFLNQSKPGKEVEPEKHGFPGCIRGWGGDGSHNDVCYLGVQHPDLTENSCFWIYTGGPVEFICDHSFRDIPPHLAPNLVESIHRRARELTRPRD